MSRLLVALIGVVANTFSFSFQNIKSGLTILPHYIISISRPGFSIPVLKCKEEQARIYFHFFFGVKAVVVNRSRIKAGLIRRGFDF
jgi:hypothetical protein